MTYTVDGRGPADPGFHPNVGPAIIKHNLLSKKNSESDKRRYSALILNGKPTISSCCLRGSGKGSTDFYFLMMSLLKHASPSSSASSLLA